jgi:hypothetical protein
LFRGRMIFGWSKMRCRSSTQSRTLLPPPAGAGGILHASLSHFH